MITEIIARSGSPSQLIRPLITWSLNSTQLITLKVGSNIHFQAKVDSTVGMMKGSRMKARVSALPLKWRVRGRGERRAPGGLNNSGGTAWKKGVAGATPEKTVVHQFLY